MTRNRHLFGGPSPHDSSGPPDWRPGRRPGGAPRPDTTSVGSGSGCRKAAAVIAVLGLGLLGTGAWGVVELVQRWAS